MVAPGALAALVMLVLALPASAQRGDRDRDRDRERDRDRDRGECKSEILNAAGRAKFRPLTRGREMAGNGAAMADAVANWQRDVSAKYGSEWMLWDRLSRKPSNLRTGAAWHRR